MKIITGIFVNAIFLLNCHAQIPEATSGFSYPLTGAFSNNGGYSFLDAAYYSGNLVYHPGEDWNQPTLNGGCSTGCSIDKCLDVKAAANGQVKYVNTSAWGGIVLEHSYQNQTWYSQYGHIINPAVTVGQNVSKGQKIAEIGDVGTSCAHLHFEIREADHPNPINGAYFNYGNNGIGSYSNVVNWYEDPDLFIASHPPYSNSNINCVFSVNSTHSLDHWKFWKNPSVSSEFYRVKLNISNLPPGYGWSLYILDPNGNIISDVRTNMYVSADSFYFSANENDPNYPNAFGYKFRLTPNGYPNTTLVLSEPFYISKIPSLTVSISPSSILRIGLPAVLTWFTSGGIPGLQNGGWTGKIRFQWYHGTPGPNLDSVPVSQGTYEFIVPDNIPGAPGSGFSIGASNADAGTSIPGGHVFAFTNTFSIQSATGLNQISSAVPKKFELSQNYPNPFNPETKIKFAIPERSFVILKVFDTQGKKKAELVNAELTAGAYEFNWNASGITSGIYFYRIEANNYSETKRMIMLK